MEVQRMTKEESERVSLLLKCAKLESMLKMAKIVIECQTNILYDICRDNNMSDLSKFIGESVGVLTDIDRTLKNS